MNRSTVNKTTGKRWQSAANKKTKIMVGDVGFEPTASGSGDQRSIRAELIAHHNMRQSLLSEKRDENVIKNRTCQYILHMMVETP
jgi:hypothetical protein